jgi:hypothetical protein
VDREDRIGYDDLVIESREVSHTEIDLNTLDWAMAAPTAPSAEPQFQTSITMCPLDGTTGVHAEQPLEGKPITMCPLDGTTGVQQPLEGKSSDYARMTVDGHQGSSVTRLSRWTLPLSGGV